MASWAESWETTERRITDWIASELGATYGKNAYAGEIPKDFNYNNKNGMWYFAIPGGNAPIDFDFNMNTPGGCGEREMNAEFEGVWHTRKDAMNVAGKLMDICPPTEYTVKQVRRIRIAAQPDIQRASINYRPGQNEGGVHRVWRVRCELLVLFKREES